MPLHLSARLHAAAHGLFRPKDEKQVRALYNEVAAQFAAAGLVDDASRAELIIDIASDIASQFGLDGEDGRHRPIHKLVQSLFDGDDLFLLPDVDWSQKYTTAQYWDIRDALTYQKRLLDNYGITCHLITQGAGMFVQSLYEACPALYDHAPNDDGISIQTDLLQSIGDVADVTEAMQNIAFAEDLTEADLFTNLQARLEANVIAASGGNPSNPKAFTKAPKLPSQFDAKSSQHLIDTYLAGTPLLDLFDQKVNFVLPTKSRFEHHHIVAGSGHGKTQTLQYLIAQDLEAVAQGERSVVVLDSQGDLIRNISNLSVFAEGGALHDRIVIIDPSDVEWPVSLNLFDVGMDRLNGYAPLERERLTNSILELYDFVLGSLLDAAMTQKQSVIFRYVTRLMLHIPDATIHTLRELMEPNADKKFAKHIAKLTGTARQFFESEFTSKEFDQTKRQVLRRLWGILENQTFERMFSHPRSKLDLFTEMNAGKIILINTAKDLLKEQGTEIFGRFFIAMIAQAAQERATLPENKRLPTLVYIDEAQDYFDRNIGLILAQARKQNVGMVLAHQFMGQLEPKLQDAFAANTSIKFAGGVSNKDARSLASQMGCDARFIEQQSKGSFATSVRGLTTGALPLSFPFGVMEGFKQMPREQRSILQQLMRDRYAVHYSELRGQSPAPDEAERVEKEGSEPEPSERPEGHIDTDARSEW